MLLRRVVQHVKDQNWTAAALDFGIVVVGVLLALWASQWASDRDARRSARIATEAMDADLMLTAIGTMRRFTTQQCLVDAIKRTSAAASVPDGEPFVAPPPAKQSLVSDSVFPTYYPVALWNYPTQAFDRAVAIGAFDHMDARRAAEYATAYEWVRALGEANAAEEILESRLAIVAMIDRIEAPTRLAIRRDLAELDGWNRSVLNSGRSLFDALHRLGIEPTEKDRTNWSRYNELARAIRGDCVIDLPLDFSGRAVCKSWSHEVEQ